MNGLFRYKAAKTMCSKLGGELSMNTDYTSINYNMGDLAQNCDPSQTKKCEIKQYWLPVIQGDDAPIFLVAIDCKHILLIAKDDCVVYEGIFPCVLVDSHHFSDLRSGL